MRCTVVHTKHVCPQPALLTSSCMCLFLLHPQICNTMKVTQVKLDLDSVSHSKRGGLPETTTLGILTAGKYVFRTTEFGGRNSDGLLNSGAVVTYYAENEQVSFVVGRDGYVSGISWFVFFLDGATGEIKPCDRENCPESLCAGGGSCCARRERSTARPCVRAVSMWPRTVDGWMALPLS